VTKYEIKARIIEMLAATQFRGMDTESPYRHINHFTLLCKMVRHGVPDEWFKWNLFPYSLVSEGKTWYTFASFDVKGNWNKLTKKFLQEVFSNKQGSTSKEASDHLDARRRGRDRPS
jgi:hypothetical protein